MTRRLPAVFLALVLLFAACSDDGGDDAGTGSTDGTESTIGAEESGEGDSTADTATDTATPEAEGPDVLTVQGLDEARIGMTEDAATSAGVVDGAWAPNCETSDSTETFALLAPPTIGQLYALDGSVSAVLVLDETVSTQPGGVAVGTPRDEAADSFLAAGFTMEVDESTAETYGAHFWTATDADGDRFGGSIDPDTGLVTAIATPDIPVCE